MLFSTSSNAEAINCNSDIFKKIILKNISSIIDYKFNLKATTSDTNILTEVFGQPPDKLKTITTFDDTIDSTTTNLYDGNYQWVVTRRGKHKQTIRINLSKTTNRKMPFDTNYYIFGTGLLSGEDYIGTIRNLLSIYNFRAKCDKEKILFIGEINPHNFKEYAKNKKSFKKNKAQIISFLKRFSNLLISFKKNGFLPIEYTLGNPHKPNLFHVVFSDFIINQGLSSNTFKYKPIKDNEPIDITKSLLNQTLIK